MQESTVTIKKCRKDHRCWWCGERIEKGTWEDGELMTVKCHPECLDVWWELSREEGYPVEVMFGEFERGSSKCHEIEKMV